MNTQIKHTPGPWHIGMKPGPMIYGQNGEQVADCRCIDLLGRDEAQANLALIAAAPAMYEALRLAEHNLTEIENYIGGDAVPAGLLDTVRAAIAQAEGRTL